MTHMVDFFTALLQTLAAFLAAEPIIYLFGLVLLCFLCKAIKSLT